MVLDYEQRDQDKLDVFIFVFIHVVFLIFIAGSCGEVNGEDDESDGSRW